MIDTFMVEEPLLLDTEVIETQVSKFKTPTEFSQYIEKQANIVGISCFDMLVDYCVKNELEIETVSTLVSTSLKEKIRVEAETLNLLKRKRDGILPFD
jgi:hypothetical protein